MEDFSQSIPSIAGFRATALIGSWVQRRKLRPKPMTISEEYEIATKIQAGYRGMITRENARPKPPTIAGFRVTATVATWVNKCKKRQKVSKPMTESEEEDVATRIQAGYRGSKVREEMKFEEDTCTESDSAAVKTIHGLEADQHEHIDRRKVESDSGTSSKEITPKHIGVIVETSDEGEKYEESFTEDSESNGEGSGNDDETTDSEDEEEVRIDRTPLALLKSLVGIMNISSSKSKFGIKTNKVGITDEKGLESEPAENKASTSGQSSSGEVKKDEEVG